MHVKQREAPSFRMLGREKNARKWLSARGKGSKRDEKNRKGEKVCG